MAMSTVAWGVLFRLRPAGFEPAPGMAADDAFPITDPGANSLGVVFPDGENRRWPSVVFDRSCKLRPREAS